MQVIVKIIVGFCFITGVAYSTDNQSFIVTNVQAVDCVTSNNLLETAADYINRCRTGGINSEFPANMYSIKLGEIKGGSGTIHKLAWRLLNDEKFIK